MQKYKMKEIGNIVSGGTPSTSNPSYWDGNIPWITPKDLSKNIDRYVYQGERNITNEGLNNSSAKLVPFNTVLLSSRAPIGYLALAGNELCTNQGFKSIICNESIILPKYLYYLLKTKIDDLIGISTGSTFLELSKTALENYEIRIHNIEVQQHIVNTIGTIDDLIEKYDLIINKLEKTILLKYESDIRKESKIYQLKDIVEVIDNRGKTPPLINDDKNHPIIEVAQLAASNMLINYNSFEKYVSEETYKYFFRNGHLLKDDVLISTVGTIGVAAYNFESGLSIAQNVVALRSKYSYFIYCYLINNKQEILNLDIGGVQPSIKIPHLLNQKILIPTLDNIKIYQDIFNKINAINNKKRNLTILKNKYLTKFFG